MFELVIGKDIPELAPAKNFESLYAGLDFMEKMRPSLVVFNVEASFLTSVVLERICKFLDETKTPALFVSDEDFADVLAPREYIGTLRSDLMDELLDSEIQKLRAMGSLEKRIVNLSQKERTLPLYLLGSVLILEPAVKILFLKLSTGFPLEVALRISASIQDPVKFFEFWLMFPMAGLALLRPSAWSLFAFLGVHAYSIYAHVFYEKFSWPYVQEAPHISSNLLLFFNTLLIAYFIFPENRRPFVRRTRDFFRKSVRFKVNKPMRLSPSESSYSVLAVLVDISETGALISTSETFKVQDELRLELKIGGERKAVRAIVVRELRTETEAEKIYGLKFKLGKRREREDIKSFIADSDVLEEAA